MSCENIVAFFNSPIISAAIGGAIGGSFTYFGVRETILNQKKTVQATEQAEVDAFCKAISAELESILSRYLSSIGDHLAKLPNDKPFLAFYFVTEEYFTVFNSNAHLIGKIKDDNLRIQIVKTYTNTKGHLDSLRLNNTMLSELKGIVSTSNLMNRDEALKYDQIIQQMTNYTPSLLTGHVTVVQGIQETLRSLKTANP